jgi:protein disulfide-isomerase A6
VKGFPTVKLFPRGKEQPPILFEHPDRSANAFFYFASRRVPHKNKKLHSVEEIQPWVNNVRFIVAFPHCHCASPLV